MKLLGRRASLAALIKIKFRKHRESFTKIVLYKISKNQLFIPFFYILLQKISKSYLAGGLSGYKYFRSNQVIGKFFDGSITRAFWVSRSRRYIKNIRSMDKYVGKNSETYFSELLKKNRTKSVGESNKLRILSLLPAGWARTREEFGFPHAYHLLMTAKMANVELIDLPTKAISANPESHERKIKAIEWHDVENAIAQFLPNVILISGHKRSFDPFNKEFLIEVKQRYKLKVLLLLLDDWSDEYVEMIENWGDAVDKVLIYEENCIVAQNISREKIMLWPFPRFVSTNHEVQVLKDESLRISFFGSVYLNRIPWLIFIKRICSRHQNVALEVNSSARASQYSLNVGQYLDSYCQSEITIHFLERTPGVFTFTSSIWDAFAGGSLVIAQVGSECDPISSFFRPGIDYLPFVSLSDLQAVIEEISKCPSLVNQIAHSGRDFMLTNYNPEYMYNYLAKELS